MNRRHALRTIGAAALALPSVRLLAAPAADAKLLIVFLRGGYDAANVLVPVSSSFYYESRPRIALAAPGKAANAAVSLDSDWGMHPALNASLMPLYLKSQLAFVPFAGTDDLTRSHFETQDSIELGQPLQGQRDYRSGFLNRLAATLQGSHPISFTDQLPIVFRGDLQVPNTALKALGKPGVDERQGAIIARMYQGTPLAAQVDEGFAVRGEVMRDMADEMEAASRGAITAKGFELEARRIGKLMRDQFDIGFVDVGGWDTHVGEGAASGYLAGRLEELGRGLAAFADEMAAVWPRTVVVVISEFGRTFRENGNQGTDHGHGTVYWVLGGAVHGGRVAGEQVSITAATLFQNRDFPVLNEYRSLLAGLLVRMYGLSGARLDQVFPGIRGPADLQLI